MKFLFSGFTLLELCLVILIASSLAYLSINAMHWHARTQLENDVALVTNRINRARIEAIFTRREIIVCLSDASCNASVSNRIWANQGDTPELHQLTQITTNQRALIFGKDGVMRTFGTWTICHRSQGRKIIVNRNGRTRIEAISC